MTEEVLKEAAAFRGQAAQESQPPAGALSKRLPCGLTQLDTWLERTQRVVEQTQQVLAGNVHIKNRLVSLFDPDARPIRKGKLKVAGGTEFGYKVVVVDDERGFITYCGVEHGNPEDATLLLPAVQGHQQRVGRVPHGVATDRGMASAGNERALRKLGVVRCILPKTGPTTAAEQAKEASWWFRYLQRFRAGGEGRISLLKRKYGWRRSLVRGHTGVESWVLWGAITHNLTRYGRLQAAAAR